ncbi:MAG TPA: hypothetical protein VHP83_22505 [Aggregatilineaceae bacterium]|nr:hypothetical protein [Aggregatilineaceae bacterium]
MKKLACWVLVGLILAAGLPVQAETLPTIVTFESSSETVTVEDIEAGTAITTLSWTTIGMTDPYRVTLHAYRLNSWEPVFGTESVPLEANGSREITMQVPQNFGPPTYLLSITDLQSRIVDQRTISIPYEIPPTAPEIEQFTIDAQQLDAVALSQGQALVTVSWNISNRPPTANPVFEQVFTDNSYQSIELPRANFWIPSRGQGVVAPGYRAGLTRVVLRLRLVDMASQEVYAEETVTLPVIGSAPVVPATPIPPTPIPAFPQNPAPVPGTGQIVSFKVSPDTVNPGSAVTLAWEVVGTGGITIEQQIPNTSVVTQVVQAQSPKGTATVYLPDYAAYSVRFILWTAARDASMAADVQVHCPYTFFFGSADGCPIRQGVEIDAAYQRFEGGIMVWRGDTREIYVLYDDGQYQNGTATYTTEASYASMPDPDSTLMPPLDRFVPTHGFGKIWANAPGVREKLGWALAPEQSYRMTIQDVAMTREPPPDVLFYFTMPDARVVGTGFGVWRVVE